MKWTSCAAGLSGFVALWSIGLVQLVAQTGPVNGAASNTELNATALAERATRVLNKYCVSCHGPDKQKGKVQLSALETIDAVNRQKLFGKAQELIQLAEMPPEKARQPDDAERKILLQWLNSQLTGKAAKALAEKLLRFEYGNVVDHKKLFSG